MGLKSDEKDESHESEKFASRNSAVISLCFSPSKKILLSIIIRTKSCRSWIPTCGLRRYALARTVPSNSTTLLCGDCALLHVCQCSTDFWLESTSVYLPQCATSSRLTLSKPDLDKDQRRKQHLSDPKKTWFQIARAFLPKKYRILKKNFVRALDT